MRITWYIPLFSMALIFGCSEDSTSSDSPDSSADQDSDLSSDLSAEADVPVADSIEEPEPDQPEPDQIAEPDVLLEPDVADDREIPEPIGPYGVGLASITVRTDSGRILPTYVWYPVPPDSPGPTARYIGLIESAVAVWNVEPAEGGPFPMVVFSHGNQGLRAQSTFLTEHLAAHGYVVVAPDHQYNTFTDNDGDRITEVAMERPRDLSACIDRMLSPEDSDLEFFADLVDPDLIGVAGHSFGAYTSLAIAGGELLFPEEQQQQCEDDPGVFLCNVAAELPDPLPILEDARIRVSLPMAPAGYTLMGESGVAEIGIPVFIMVGDADISTPPATESQPIYEALQSPKFLLVLDGGRHFTFSNICDILVFIPDAPEVMAAVCGPDAPPIEEHHALIRDASLLFFDAYLLNDDEAMTSFISGDFVGDGATFSMSL